VLVAGQGEAFVDTACHQIREIFQV
jgi:hypothetical protein